MGVQFTGAAGGSYVVFTHETDRRIPGTLGGPTTWAVTNRRHSARVRKRFD